MQLVTVLLSLVTRRGTRRKGGILSPGNKNGLKEQKIAHQFPRRKMPAWWSMSYKTSATKKTKVAEKGTEAEDGGRGEKGEERGRGRSLGMAQGREEKDGG